MYLIIKVKSKKKSFVLVFLFSWEHPPNTITNLTLTLDNNVIEISKKYVEN
jgi:hypothetical protein